MAKRIATEYVKVRFECSPAGLSDFMVFMKEQQLQLQVLILENGNQSLVLEDVAGHEAIRMTFERHYNKYVSECSCTIVEQKLTNAMRKAVSVFRGSAIVNRIYSHYTMVYYYNDGAVQRIVEKNQQGEHVVFQKKNTSAQKLQQIFDSRLIERKIKLVHQEVDVMLDQRILAQSAENVAAIDARLKELTNKLFKLEAN